jgi:hypothetical protein
MVSALPLLDDGFLDRIQIAKPCEADWDRMKGDDRVRRCMDCKLDVYNISAMTRAEAATLIRQREGRLCIRMYMRQDGTLITRDCHEVMRRARRSGAAAFGVVLATLFISGVIAHRCGADIAETQPPPPNPLEHALMGAPPPRPPEPNLGSRVGEAAPPLDPSPSDPIEVKGDVKLGKVKTPDSTAQGGVDLSQGAMQ